MAEATEAVDTPVETTNTETTGAQSEIVKGGGDAIVSFDDLESVTATQQRAKELEVKTTMDAVEKVKSEKGDGTDKTKAKKIADKIASKTEKTEAKKTAKEVVEDDKTADAPTEPEPLPDVKTYKIKNGHADVELRADTLIPTNIDGVEESIPLDELRRGYSGQKVVTQRFQQLADEKRRYEDDKQQVDTFIQDVFTAAKDDPFQSVLKIAERAGLDPVEYRLSLMDALSDQTEKWSQMTDEQRQAYKVQLENDQLKKRVEDTTVTREKEQAMVALDTRVNEIQEELGITRGDFADMYYAVENHFQQEGISKEITPELVAQFFVDRHNESAAVEILSGVNKELGQDWEAVNTIMEVAEDNPDLTQEDLKEIAQEVWGNKKAEKVSKKLAKGKPDMVQSQRPSDPQKIPLSFDDLDMMV